LALALARSRSRCLSTRGSRMKTSGRTRPAGRTSASSSRCSAVQCGMQCKECGEMYCNVM
jgi:hypothetical protein